MKKQTYITPAIIVVNITTVSMIADSPLNFKYNRDSVTEGNASEAASRGSSWGDDE